MQEHLGQALLGQNIPNRIPAQPQMHESTQHIPMGQMIRPAIGQMYAGNGIRLLLRDILRWMHT